jgi:hypothetical protein
MYVLVSDDARCPSGVTGTRGQLYALRKRLIARSWDDVYLGLSSGGINPRDVRVVREDRLRAELPDE